jgi:hypothetical protein
MDDVSIPLLAGIVDLLVERTAARLGASVVASSPGWASMRRRHTSPVGASASMTW